MDETKLPPSGLQRPGYSFLLRGDCLHPTSDRWSESQRKRGVFIRMVYLTGSEEERCIAEGENKGKHAGITQIRTAVQAFADVIDSDEGPAPGGWTMVPPMDRDAFWEALGPRGRQLAGSAFNRANSPEPEARQVVTDTFRVLG